MKKLTAQEIIEILRENSTVENFCDEQYFLEIPKDFKFSEQTQLKLNAYIKAYNEWEAPSEFNNSKQKYSRDNPFYIAYVHTPNPYKERFEEFSNHLGLGRVEEVASYGGEDCGSTYYSVKHFIDHDVYLRVDRWYQSHYGTDFGDWNDAVKEVKPATKTITVYE